MNNLNLEPSMRTSPVPGQTPSGNAYAPSVPISVYRQLAAELQSAKATAELLSNQNQQLTRQNQQLRQEIDRVVQAASQLQQMANSFADLPQPAPVEPSEIPLEMVTPVRQPMPQPVAPPRPVRTKPAPTPMQMVEMGSIIPKGDLLRTAKPTNKPQSPEPMILSDELFTEQEEVRSRRPVPPEAAKDLNGIWLVVVIGFIVITAFGAGFMVVRPLLPNR
jgi:FtsZ-binding cell division protein ZapB